MSTDDSVFGRWSRLKQAARRGGATPVLPADPDSERRTDVDPAPVGEAIPITPSTPPIAGAADVSPPVDEAVTLPPIDSLGATSDYSPFLKDGVPEHLRSAALRVLWRSDASWAAPEIMDIHNLDYSFPTVPDVVNTAYRVGRGFVDEVVSGEEAVEAGQLAAAPSAEATPNPDHALDGAEGPDLTVSGDGTPSLLRGPSAG